MTTSKKYERAKQRVRELKGFYNHLKVFLIVNGVLYLLKNGWLTSLMPSGFPIEFYYFEWINLNILVWGLILLVHGLTLLRHKLPFLKNWEERQIKKFMEQDREESERLR